MNNVPMTDTASTDDLPVEFEVVDSKRFVFADGTEFTVEFVGPVTVAPVITPATETSDAYSWCGTGRGRK
jgi:hypothetical protein